jgi:hypothetical protein
MILNVEDFKVAIWRRMRCQKQKSAASGEALISYAIKQFTRSALNAPEKFKFNDTHDVQNKMENASRFLRELRWQLAIFLIALGLRVLLALSLECDWYGDSYHHWLISELTLLNGFHYSDFKPMPNMSIVWLPLYHYLTAFLIWTTGIHGLTIPHSINIILGSLSCILAYEIAGKIFASRWIGVVSGLILAFQPWYIGINVLGLTETASSFFILASLLFYVKGKTYGCAIFSALGMLTRYENWIFSAILFSLYVYDRKRLGFRSIAVYVIGVSSAAGLWCYWSLINTGGPLTWLHLEAEATRWCVELTVGLKREYWHLLHYFFTLTRMTCGLSVLAAAMALKNGVESRKLLFIAMSLFTIISVQYYFGMNLGEERFAVNIIPFVAILCSPTLSKIKSAGAKLKFNSNVILVLGLTSLTIVPMISQIWTFNANTYSIHHEMRAGAWLKQNYAYGTLICDSPAVIYYSGLNIKLFASSESLTWYGESRNETGLYEWFRAHNVQYLVWEEVPHSATWRIFPELSDAQTHKLGLLTFKIAYVDVGWEHDFGVPNIYIFEIAYA